MATDNNAPKFARVRAITADVLTFRQGQPRFLMLLSPMYVGKQLEKDKEAATLVHALDMETGQEGIVLCSAVMRSELTEQYPKQTYAGKGFEFTLTKQANAAEKIKYNHFSISEVSVPDDLQGRKHVSPPPGAVVISDDMIAKERAARLEGKPAPRGK